MDTGCIYQKGNDEEVHYSIVDCGALPRSFNIVGITIHTNTTTNSTSSVLLPQQSQLLLAAQDLWSRPVLLVEGQGWLPMPC
jgi:hypothetical protein